MQSPSKIYNSLSSLQFQVVENTGITNFGPFATDTSFPLIIQDESISALGNDDFVF